MARTRGLRLAIFSCMAGYPSRPRLNFQVSRQESRPAFDRALPSSRAIQPRTESPLKRALPVLFPYAVFVLLALVSWNRWIEPYVDSGRELMVPWRLSQGEAMYRDVRFYYGPLAPLLAAEVDSVAGRSLQYVRSWWANSYSANALL